MLSGGVEVVGSGGTALGTTIVTRGLQFVVSGGGVEVVFSGGTTRNPVVSAGGILELAPGGTASGSILFQGTSGELQIDGTLAGGLLQPTATISGLALGDQIDLSDIAFATSASAVICGSQRLVITVDVTPVFRPGEMRVRDSFELAPNLGPLLAGNCGLHRAVRWPG